jgi:anti-anti-sigma factor
VHALVPFSLPSAGRITVEHQDGESVLQLLGEIDAETVAAYERDRSAVSDVVAVDLTEVTFLSSSAVSFVIRQTQPIRDRGQLPAMRGLSACARRVLELLGAISLFADAASAPPALPATRRGGQQSGAHLPNAPAHGVVEAR